MPSVNSFTEYFDSFTTDNSSASTEIVADWTVLSQNTTGASNTATFGSGIKIKTGKTGDFKIKTSSQQAGSYTCKSMIQFPKSTVASMEIPVRANATISIVWSNNKAGSEKIRGLLASVSAGATIKTVSGTASTTAFYSNTTIEAGAYEVVTFNYVGDEGIVTIKCCKDSEGNAADGACYIGLVNVSY